MEASEMTVKPEISGMQSHSRTARYLYSDARILIYVALFSLILEIALKTVENYKS